jgi:tetratricopeptide (TPR) repeat protein
MSSNTLLFCTSYFSDQAAWSHRYQRWLDHHLAISWGVEAVAVIDDGSPIDPPDARLGIIEATELGRRDLPKRSLVRFKDNLGRPSTLRYPGWWRSFCTALDLAEIYGFDKIVHVESDTYLLSTRVLDLIEDTSSGWTLFWSAHFGWPETALQIICRDAFDRYSQIRRLGPHGMADEAAENLLPYTRIEKSLIGDRYSDFQKPIPGNADYAVQVLPGMATSVPTSWSRRLKYRKLASAAGTLAPVIDQSMQPAKDADSKVVLGAVDAAALRDRATAAYQRGDYASAIDGLDKTVALLPEDPDVRKFLAAALMQTGRVDEAIAQGIEAARLAPDDAGLANMLGAFYASKDSGADALREWQRALHLDITDATPLSNILLVELRLGLGNHVSTSARKHLIDALLLRLTRGTFSRRGLNTLLSLWNPSLVDRSTLQQLIAASRQAVTLFSEEEARGLSIAARAAGDAGLALSFLQAIAQSPQAREEDKRMFSELKLAVARGD